MQQQLGPWTSRGAAGPPSSSGQQRAGFALALRQGGCRRWACASQGNHNAARFRDLRPEQLQLQDRDHLALPAGERDAGRPNSHVLSLAAAPDDWQPRQLWDGEGPPGSFQPANPWVQRFRVRQLRLPGPPTLPGSDYWEVEMLNDYKAELPSVRVTDNHVQLRLGLLGRVHNPPLTPFVYYRGIEHVQYSWVDRVLQTLFVAGYAAVHLTIFSCLAALHPGFAAAVGLNWMRQRLSIPKVAVLLFLASQDRVWLYWGWLAAKLADIGLKRLAPSVRRFFWANFTIWALYVLLTPGYYYPLPFGPFAPGTQGPHDVY